MKNNKIDYERLKEYIKYTSPVLTSQVHEFLRLTFRVDSYSSRSYAITRLVKLGFIERDKKSPNQLIHYISRSAA